MNRGDYFYYRKLSGSLIILIFFFIFSLFSISGDVQSGVSIIVTNASVLIQNIPDQIIPMNSNKTNAFDLDDYFDDELPMTFTASEVNNISIVIDSSTNVVSFYPNYSFTGIRTVVFTADNGLATKESNTVSINVTNDSRSPTWSNAIKDKTNIEQNTVVRFNASWNDDIYLNSYFLSINQGSGWVNNSAYYFTGTTNISTYPLQISASGGTIVYWRIIGFDLAGNMNQTSIYNFTVNTSSTTTTTSTGGGGTSSSDEADDTLKTPSIKAPKKNPEYTVTPSDGFKLELKQTESGQVSFKISNSGAKQISFFIKVNDLGTIDYSLSENNFTLEIGDSRVVTIDVPTTKYTPIGIYYGKINVFTSYDDVEIPLVVIINPYENLFDLNITIPREFKEVLPGNVVKANLTLSNLKDIEDRNFTMYYAITDFYGNVIDSRYEEINFNTRTVTFEKEFDIPEKTERGNYLFISRGLSNNNEVFDADDFTIGEEFDAWSIITSNMIFILILISALIVAFLMVRYHKAKEKTRLLNLYLMITELDKLVKEGKFDQAVDIFVRIKSAYHEPVSQTLLKNKEALKIEMEKLANDLDINVIQKIEARNKKDDEKDKKADSKKTDDEKKSQETKVIKNDDAPKKETEKSVNPEQKAIVKKEDVTQEGKTPEQKKALLEKDPGEKRGALLEKDPGEKMRDPGEKFKTQKKEIISQTVKQSINKKTESSDEKKTDSTKKERSPVKKRIVHKLNKIKSKKKL